MAFSVSEFKANGAQFGFIRPAYFMANIAKIPGWMQAQGGQTQFLCYLCSGGNIPGITIAVNDERRWGYGPTQKIPYDVVHPDVTLTFYCDGNAAAYAMFDQWLRSIVTYYDPTDVYQGAAFGEIQYPSNYLTNLEMYAYNEAPGADNPTEIIRTTMYDAFPVSLSDLNMNWGDDGSIATFSVTFVYRYHTIQKNTAASYLSGSGGIALNSGWVSDIANLGFAALNNNKTSLLQQAESLTAGFIGAPALANALNSLISGNLNVGSIIQSVNQLSSSSIGQDISSLF
jgi:hypothetical protein